jgi:TetR/AcrR family transcriptional regulator
MAGLQRPSTMTHPTPARPVVTRTTVPGAARAAAGVRPRASAARAATTRAPAANGTTHRRLGTEERQREIVAAVLSLAREHGPDAITTQAVADRVGVTQGAIFRHFPDKQAIWLAVFRWVRAALRTVFESALAKGGSPLAQIEHAFTGHVEFIAANPGVPRVMFHELQYPGDSPVRAEVRAMISGYRSGLAGLFAQAKAAGELPRKLDADLATMLYIGTIQSLVIQASLSGDEASMTRRSRRAFALLRDGYRGRN